jgi:hypothetical protein
MRARPIFVALLLALPLVVAADDSDVTEVSVHSTPGKPMMFFDNAKPAEEVAAVRGKDGAFTLVVRVNVPRAGVTKYTEETADLTKDEWNDLMKVVTDKKLLEWAPEEQKQIVYDYGNNGFAVRGKKENVRDWGWPIGNYDAPRALFDALGALVKKKMMKLTLSYISSG